MRRQAQDHVTRNSRNQGGTPSRCSSWRQESLAKSSLRHARRTRSTERSARRWVKTAATPKVTDVLSRVRIQPGNDGSQSRGGRPAAAKAKPGLRACCFNGKRRCQRGSQRASDIRRPEEKEGHPRTCGEPDSRLCMSGNGERGEGPGRGKYRRRQPSKSTYLWSFR
jgi:hypothetical protein